MRILSRALFTLALFTLWDFSVALAQDATATLDASVREI